ncbi:hypothetical protein FRC09_013311 [Ceratobasidium sp. 395]|nr:hypothetical protein FRC09_013311 [Ceratobasidium sp. 395]
MVKLETLEQNRIERFLYLSSFVVALHVHARPQHWVDWTHLERLLPLVAGAPDGRSVLMPNVQEAYLGVEGWNRRSFAPFVRLFASPSLRTLLMDPPSNKVYTQLAADDAAEVLELVTLGINPSSQEPCALDIFPDEKSGASREDLVRLLPRSFTPITSLSISAWMLSPEIFSLLAQYRLVLLHVQGRFSANPGNLALLPNLDIPEGSFEDLRDLTLNNVSFSDIVQILRTPRLVDHLHALRLHVAQVLDLGLEDDDEDRAYMTLFNQVAKAAHLKRLTIVSGRDDSEGPYSLPAAIVNKLRGMRLSHLRLYNITAGDSVGFHELRADATVAWGNLTQLSMLSQDLLPSDLIALSRLPKLWRIAANVSPALGRPFGEELGQGFSRQLHLVSRFRFGVNFFDAGARPQHGRALHRIIVLLTDLCPSGLSIHAERDYHKNRKADVEDMIWLEKLLCELRECGVTRGDQVAPKLITSR